MIARAKRRRAGPATLRWGTLIMLVAAWELAFAFIDARDFIAPPSDVFPAIPEMLGEQRVIEGLWVTLQEFLLAFVIASTLGILAGTSLGITRRLFGPSRNLLQILFTLPQVALYPLFVLWLGVGFNSKVAFGVTHGFFPVVLTTMAAAREVEPSLLESVRAMGGGRIDALRKVVLPAIVPHVVAGLRVGAAITLLAVLLAQLMVATEGIGEVFELLSSSFEPARLDALVIVVCLFAVAVNTLIRRLELRLSRWRAA